MAKAAKNPLPNGHSPSSGKLEAVRLAMEQIEKQYGRGSIMRMGEAEHALDPLWAQKLGVNLEELLISQPDTGEQALEIAESLIRSGGVDVLVIDSVAALVPRAEVEGEVGASVMG